jgi:hypothetical protein
LGHKFTVAYGSDGVKRIEMRMCKDRVRLRSETEELNEADEAKDEEGE